MTSLATSADARHTGRPDGVQLFGPILVNSPPDLCISEFPVRSYENHPYLFFPWLAPRRDWCGFRPLARGTALRAREFAVGERRERPAAGLHQHRRARALTRRDRRRRPHLRLRAIKTNVGDSVNVVVHLERRPGRRFVSEVVEIHGYDPDRDEYNYAFIFDSHKELL